MNRTLPCLLFAFFCIPVLAQKDCRQEEYQQQVLNLHPVLRIEYNTTQAFSRQRVPFVINGNTDTVVSRPVPQKIIIPVVVHVLWNTSAQNISDAQVLSQIDVLNKDFAGLNADRNKIPAYFSGLAADCGISFALAKTDPQGHATTGIVRRQTNMNVFSFDDRVKSHAAGGDDTWNADSYLNIWVCNLTNGISGYASSPGGPKEKDGIVISTSAFGIHNTGTPFNKGRTAVHETGHWLNLRHIWGDAGCGDDKVDDTPAQQGANRGCSIGEKFSCGSTAHGDMYMNYMDFSDDACMYMFTKGQRERMRALFENGGLRSSLLFSGALIGDGLLQEGSVSGTDLHGFDVFLYPNPAAGSITLQFADNTYCNGKKIYIYNYLGQVVKTMVCVSKMQQINISALQAGLYFIKVEGGQTNAMKKFVKQ